MNSSRTGLNEILVAVARVPETFRRDTPMLLKALDNIEAVNRELNNETRATFQPGFMLKNQAD